MVSQVISDLERMGMKPSPVVSRAVTMIDSWALLTGRYLHTMYVYICTECLQQCMYVLCLYVCMYVYYF